ncbi:hypothetical protein KXW54_007926, partial [Aspergillus fumigatus]
MILAELAKEAGFPPGVISIIHGYSKAVNLILDSPSRAHGHDQLSWRLSCWR